MRGFRQCGVGTVGDYGFDAKDVEDGGKEVLSVGDVVVGEGPTGFSYVLGKCDGEEEVVVSE